MTTRDERFRGVRALIFDLDGTLIDSKTDLILSVNATLEHMGHAALPEETVCSYIGRGAAALNTGTMLRRRPGHTSSV